MSSKICCICYCITTFFHWSPCNRSGTEEEYGELEQLLHDIHTYRQDKAELDKQEKELNTQKKNQEKQKGEEMREAALIAIKKSKHQI